MNLAVVIVCIICNYACISFHFMCVKQINDACPFLVPGSRFHDPTNRVDIIQQDIHLHTSQK